MAGDLRYNEVEPTGGGDVRSDVAGSEDQGDVSPAVRRVLDALKAVLTPLDVSRGVQVTLNIKGRDVHITVTRRYRIK